MGNQPYCYFDGLYKELNWKIASVSKVMTDDGVEIDDQKLLVRMVVRRILDESG